MKNIYIRLKDNCSFLTELGYSYCCNIKSFIHPSVLFSSDNEQLQISVLIMSVIECFAIFMTNQITFIQLIYL